MAITIPGTRLDAGETVFFARELEYVMEKTYDTRYAELQARKIFPCNFDAGPAASSITYYEYDQVGMAKVVSNYAKDLPRADIRGKKHNANIETIATAYGYSLHDVQAAHAAGKPLEQRKANAAKRAIEQKINSTAYNGDAAYNLPGLLSNPNIPVATANTKTAGGTTWCNNTGAANGTPDEILDDLNNVLVNPIVETTNLVEQPNTVLLPVKKYNYIATTRASTLNNDTILKVFLENNPYIDTVIPVNELKGAGTSGVDIGIAYRRDPDKLELHIPLDFEQLPVQEKGLEYEVPCHARLCGVIVYYPLSVNIIEGI